MWGIIQKKDTHTLDFNVTLQDNMPALAYRGINLKKTY